MQKIFGAACADRSMRLVFPLCGEKLRCEAKLIEDAHRMVRSAELKDDWEHLMKPGLQVKMTDRDEICRRLVSINERIGGFAEEHGMTEALNHPSEMHLDFIS